MLELIIKSYAEIFLFVGIVSIVIFILGLYWIMRTPVPALHHQLDLAAIAGDDIIATQLDLARAYIETKNKLIAKKILKLVIAKGNKAQQEEAKVLLDLV